jgi:hypothetical protein
VDKRAERKATNENLFREVNEQIEEEVEHAPLVRSSPVDFVCECSALDCVEPVRMTLDEYQQVRAEPTRFVVLSGHESADVERVVDRHARFVVVQKVGAAATVAENGEPD